jgi:hypothetical protein
MKSLLFALALLLTIAAPAQDTALYRLKGVYFPGPTDRSTKFSIGFTSTTMPYDITEELHYRIPAIDVRWVKRLSQEWALDLRGSLQVFQNLFTAGLRKSITLSDRMYLGLGGDVGYWFGMVNLESIKTKGHGFQAVPNVSVARRFKRRVLLTFRADAQTNFGIQTFAQDTKLVTEHRTLSGSSYSLVLEQPFYGNKVLSVGLRGIYTDFFWQTWTLFETFDRNLFYPQVIVLLNL